MTNHRDHFEHVINHLTDTEKGYIAEMRRDIGVLAVDKTGIPITTSLLLLNTILGKNTLIEGDSGTGKTHMASVIGSVAHQIPYDLFTMRPVIGTPNVSANEIFATQDIVALQQGVDKGFLYFPFHLPLLFIDEINRYTPGGQNLIRGGIASDVWTFANHAWLIEGQTVVAAINPEAHGGTYPLNENLVDNFGIVVPPAKTNPLFHEEMIVNARDRARKDLGMSVQEAQGFLEFYHQNKNDAPKIREHIQALQERTHQRMKQKGIPHIYNGDIQAIRQEVMSIPMEQEATLLQYATLAEINLTTKFGDKRCDDPISDDTHDSGRAGSKMIAPLHGRFLADWNSTAKGIAWLREHEQVNREDLQAAFLYAGARRIFPTKEHYAKIQSSSRHMPIGFAGAKDIMDGVCSQYDIFSASPAMSIIRHFIEMYHEQGTLPDTQNKKLRQSIENLRTIADHPFARMFLEFQEYESKQ